MINNFLEEMAKRSTVFHIFSFQLTELNDQLYTDAGQAMTFVQDAMHSNLTILKLMLLQQLANERDKKTPVSEKE